MLTRVTSGITMMEVNYMNVCNLNTALRVIVDHALVVIPENILRLAWRWLWGEWMMIILCGRRMKWRRRRPNPQVNLYKFVGKCKNMYWRSKWRDLWHRWAQLGSQRRHGTPPRPVCTFLFVNLKYSDIVFTIAISSGPCYRHCHQRFAKDVCLAKYLYYKSYLNIRLRIDDVELDPSRYWAQWGWHLGFPFIFPP